MSCSDAVALELLRPQLRMELLGRCLGFFDHLPLEKPSFAALTWAETSIRPLRLSHLELSGPLQLYCSPVSSRDSPPPSVLSYPLGLGMLPVAKATDASSQRTPDTPSLQRAMRTEPDSMRISWTKTRLCWPRDSQP